MSIERPVGDQPVDGRTCLAEMRPIMRVTDRQRAKQEQNCLVSSANF